MEIERIHVKFIDMDGNIADGDLDLYEESPDDASMVSILSNIGKCEKVYIGDNFFHVLVELRKDLEKDNIQLLCNGAAENVYPSRMQIDMGTGRSAYKLYLGQKARLRDVVDIFEQDESLSYTSLMKQEEFYNKWIESLEANVENSCLGVRPPCRTLTLRDRIRRITMHLRR